MAYLVPGADSATRLTNMRARLRRRVGQREDTALIADDDLDDALADALRQINKHWPVYNVGSFATVSGQQLYTGMLPAAGHELVDVFWSAAACEAVLINSFPALLDEQFASLMGGVTEDGYRYAVTPSALTILQRHRSYLKRWFGQRGVETDRDSVYLVPPPGTDGTNVYFVYTADRFDAPENVTDDLGEAASAFWAWALKVLSEALAQGRNAITQAKGADGVTVTNNASLQALRMAERYEREFYDNLLLAPSPWAVED